MDEKYSGCNIVESVVTASHLSEQKKDKKRTQGGQKKHFFARLIISALFIGVILVLHYFPMLPFAGEMTDVLRKVFCYDVFGRQSFGTTLFG
ncbi:MAG: hypothetical protein J1F69_04685 [Clostridiales bacterium]|nr:hypothetical protein [Clostridiales bacterium]